MAIVKTERKSFLDRLQQSVQMGAQVADVVQTGQQIAQRGRQLDIMQQEAKNKAEFNRVQMEQMRVQMEEMQQKAQLQADASFHNMLFKAAALPTPKARQTFFANYADKLADLSVKAGRPMSGEELERIYTEQSEAIAPYVNDIKLGLKGMADALKSPKLNREGFLKAQQVFDASFGTAEALAPSLTESSFAQAKKDLLKQFADMQSGETQEKVAAQRGAANPSLGMDPGLRKFEMDQGTELSKQVKLIPSLERQEANINDILPLLDKVGTGPIKGQPAVYFAQKLGNEDAQRLQSFLSAAGIDRVVEMASQAGARAIDSDAERKFLMDSLANLQQNPGVIRDILARQQQILRYSRDLAAAKLQHKAKGGRFIDFEFPSLSEYTGGGSAQIQGMTPPPAKPALAPQAPSNAMRQFLIEDE